MDPTNSNFDSEANDIGKTSNNAILQDPPVKLYATRVFQESTIGVLSSIVTTSSRCRRFFKLLLLSLCVSGFLYQCITFLNHVFEYPTVVDFAVDRSETYNIPAYTFCNNNAMRRSVFCSMYPEHCEVPSEEFCKKFSSYCGANATLIPKEKYRSVEDFVPYEEILKNGSIDFLKNERYLIYYYFDEPYGPFLRRDNDRGETMICYNLHSVVENSQQPVKIQKEEEDADKYKSAIETPFPEDTLIFHVDETEMLNPEKHPGVFFSLHSSFEFVNPSEKGIFMEGGRTYKIYVEMQEELLLKKPFETSCVDYEELWEQNNRTGPRTQKMCQFKCRMDYFVTVYHCASYLILYPSNETLCDDPGRRTFPTSPETSDVERDKALKKRHECIKNCQNECRVSTYTTEISMRYGIEDGLFEENLHRYIIVEIYLPHDGVKVLRHSPKYVAVEVFSSIGGFIGCWLGIALLDILDFLGSIFTVCRYAFRKRL